MREREITMHTKTGHYFSTAGKTVRHYFVLFNLTLCDTTCNHKRKPAYTLFFFKTKTMHVISMTV